MRRLAAVVLAMATSVLTACAGTDARSLDDLPLSSRPLDPGHGSLEEVRAALAEQGVPCVDPRDVPLLPRTEESLECSLQPLREQVLLVHFLSPGAARAFEAENRRAGRHGAYARTWAARTESEQAAELLARSVTSQGWS